jgi:hypothetical protein
MKYIEDLDDLYEKNVESFWIHEICILW